MELQDFHVGERLEYLIKKQYENVNAFANAIEEEKQNIYQDCKKKDLSTIRLKRYLPAFGLSFMEFFDLEGDYKPTQKITSPQEEKQFKRVSDSKSKNPIRQARHKAKTTLTAEQIRKSYIKRPDPRFNHYWNQLKEDAIISRTQHWLALHFIETLGMKSEDFLQDIPTSEYIIKDLNLELA